MLPQSGPLAPRPAPAPAVSDLPAAMHVPKCFGVCCRLHKSCEAYVRVDGSDPREPAIDHCWPDLALFQAARS